MFSWNTLFSIFSTFLRTTDFSEVEVGRTLHINVNLSGNGTLQSSSTDTTYGSKTSSEQRK